MSSGHPEGEATTSLLQVLSDIDFIANQLCRTVDGQFGRFVSSKSKDETVQKLAMLINFVADTAGRAVRRVEAQNRQLEEQARSLRRAEAQLRQAKEYTDRILDSISECLFVLSPEGVITRANPATMALFEYSEEELLGSSIDLLHEGDDVRWLEPLTSSGSFGPSETIFRKKGGETVAVQYSGSAVWDTAGTREGIVCVVQDITERKAAELSEKALRRVEKEASRIAGMSEIATGVLHNVGNAVNSVNISVDLTKQFVKKSSLDLLEKAVSLLSEHSHDPESLSRFFAEDKRGQKFPEFMPTIVARLKKEQDSMLCELTSLGEHVEHIMAIVASQQEFARSAPVREEVELSELIDKALALSGVDDHQRGIRIERDYGQSQRITIDSHKLVQILVNLISNARHALVDGAGGTVRITTELLGGDVTIAVTDDGIGIPRENLIRIFEHGFTTKETGHGFGLHISATGASELGGQLSAHSEGEGQGSTFRLTVPLRPAPKESKSRSRPNQTNGAGATGTVG